MPAITMNFKLLGVLCLHSAIDKQQYMIFYLMLLDENSEIEAYDKEPVFARPLINAGSFFCMYS